MGGRRSSDSHERLSVSINSPNNSSEKQLSGPFAWIWIGIPFREEVLIDSNGNASETKANESFDNGVFFDIEAKRTPSIVRKLFSKRSGHVR